MRQISCVNGESPARLVIALAGAAVAALLVLLGCQTTGAKPGQVNYNFFFSPADHIEELVATDDLEAASRVYEDQIVYFYEDDEDRTKVAASLAERLGQTFEPEIEAVDRDLRALSWPAAPDSWPDVHQAITAAKDLVSQAAEHEILVHVSHRPASLKRLDQTLATTEQTIAASCGEMFNSYPLSGALNFFEAYPVEVDRIKCLTPVETWGERLDGLSATDLIAINATYGHTLPDPLKRELGALHYQRLLNHGATTDFESALEAIKATREAGMDVSGVSDANIVVVNIDSIREQSTVEFPVEIEADLPFTMIKGDPHSAIGHPRVKAAQTVVTLDVPAASVDREVVSHERVESEFQSGTTTVPNPDYAAKLSEVQQATINYQQSVANKFIVDAEYCYGWGCIGKAISQIAAAAAVDNARKGLETAQAKLGVTSSTMEKPIYAPYAFNKTTIRVSKVAILEYHVLDHRNGAHKHGEFVARETNDFLVPYGLHERDRTRLKHLQGAISEDKVAEFESATMTVELSKALGSFATASSKAGQPASLAELQQHLMARRAFAQSTPQARTSKPIIRHDPRLDSVVVVLNPTGISGTGFYVREDLVLTNYHVVEGSKFAEIRTFKGEETFGKVIATDIRRDLAAIKVQQHGKAVRFYSGADLPVGETVEAMGHPAAVLEFSLTRGVVSSLRELPSKYMPNSKSVQYIQTDTAINKGNSGGPLFLGNEVVGVNNWKVIREGVEGLGFAIHYGEVLDFLQSIDDRPITGS